MAAALILAGCSGDGDNDSGAVNRSENGNAEASSNTEESNSSTSEPPVGDTGGDGSSCERFEACGGDIVGSWQVIAMCTDTAALQSAWTDKLPDECGDSVIDFSAVPSELVFTYDDTGQQTAKGHLSLTMSAYYAETCLSALYPSEEVTQAFCDQVATELPPGESCTLHEGGCACEKAASGPIDSGETYEVVGDQLLQQGEPFDYCVQGNTLRILEGAERKSWTVYVARRL